MDKYHDLVNLQPSTKVEERLLPRHDFGPSRGWPYLRYNAGQRYLRNIYALYPNQAEDLVLHLIVPAPRIRGSPKSGRSRKVVTALLWDSKLGQSVLEAEQRTLPFSILMQSTCHSAVGLLARKLQRLANGKAKQSMLTELSENGWDTKEVKDVKEF